MGYRLSDLADEDITSIAVVGIKKFGLEQARRYHDGMCELFDLLVANPRMACRRLEINPPVRVHPYKSNVVIFTIEGPDILIIRVRHGREDWMSDRE